MSEDGYGRLSQFANHRGIKFSEALRRAVDWYLSTTVYLQETDEMLEEIHPDMTREQIVGWLKFKWRIHHEGKENGNSQMIAMLEEILGILRRDDADPN